MRQCQSKTSRDGVSGRPRLFEVVQRVREINATRLYNLRKREFSGSSYNKKELDYDLNLKLDYIVAPPRMSFYMEYSTRIYNVYLKYIAPEDIHVYSIDEVFIDVTSYLNTYGLSAKEEYVTLKSICDRNHVAVKGDRNPVENPVGVLTSVSDGVKMSRYCPELLDRILKLVVNLQWNGGKTYRKGKAFSAKVLRVFKKL